MSFNISKTFNRKSLRNVSKASYRSSRPALYMYTLLKTNGNLSFFLHYERKGRYIYKICYVIIHLLTVLAVVVFMYFFQFKCIIPIQDVTNL